jgi:hypothetical protein
MSFREACGAEYRNARLLEIEALETAQELKEEHDSAFEVRLTVPASGKKQFLRTLHLSEQ